MIAKTNTSAPAEEAVISYKGFDNAWKCRDFQYKVGKTFTHDGSVNACESGFHACEYPLDVFEYYPPAGSRFAVVKQYGELSRHDGDSKVASKSISIMTEISISGLVEATIEYTSRRCKPIDPESPASATGTQGAASATGIQGAASATSYRGAASATGYKNAASATGDQGAASATGYKGAASATSYKGAASATGDHGAASATGYKGAASATGKASVAAATGLNGSAKGASGCAIVLVRLDVDGTIIHIRASKVGENGVKPGVWYSLDENGEFMECAE